MLKCDGYNIMTLYHGDCLTVMQESVPDESIDLIYMDPPFFTGRNFDAFDDRFESMDVYIEYLKIRLQECYRVLKPTGSIYIHCDWHASRYIGVMMDGIFGYDNFRNEVIWCYLKWAVKQKQFVKDHNTIWFYSKSNKWTFHTLYAPLRAATIKRRNGKKGYNTMGNDGKRISVVADEDSPGSPMQDWWDIPIVHPQTKEHNDYPTQKPEALLERIILASSNAGDMVLDPMCGSGTTLDVANRLHREFIGIDVNEDAIELAKKRTHTQQQRLIP